MFNVKLLNTSLLTEKIPNMYCISFTEELRGYIYIYIYISAFTSVAWHTKIRYVLMFASKKPSVIQNGVITNFASIHSAIKSGRKRVKRHAQDVLRNFKAFLNDN